MSLKSLLNPEVYFNSRLALEFEKEAVSYDAANNRVVQGFSPLLSFLRRDLTSSEILAGAGLINDRAGINLSDDHLQRAIRSDERFYALLQTEPLFAQFLSERKIPPDKLTFESYLELGAVVLKELGLPGRRIDPEMMRACLFLSEDQKKYFDANPRKKKEVNLADLLIGNCSESIMHEFLYEFRREFKARSFLKHYCSQPQDEKDITLWYFNDATFTDDEKTLGVRCQREFSGAYLYPEKRLFERRETIPDFVAFFNHIGHSIFYLTGIVKRDFLRKLPAQKTGETMARFVFPEGDFGDIASSYGLPLVNPSSPQAVQAAVISEQARLSNNIFGLRLSPAIFFDNLKKHPQGKP